MDKHKELVTLPIPKLVRQLAIPSIVGFFFHTMFNVVDTYYGGLISTEALAALSISFPVFFIIISLSSGVSTGTSSLISNYLGSSNKEEAQLIVSQGIVFAFILGILLSFVGVLISPFLFSILGAENQQLRFALDYINVIFIGSVFFLLAGVINSGLTSQGDTKSFRNFLVAGFFINIILTPWFLFGGLGIPAMGISGIALSTILVELFGASYLFIKLRNTGLLDLKNKSSFTPRLDKLYEISAQGIPASLNMLTVGLGIFIVTWYVSKFGTNAVAAYGIATRVEQIALLPLIGLNIAVLAIAGQNNGANKPDRVREVLMVCLKYGLILMSIGCLFTLLFGKLICNLFTDDQNVIEIGSYYLNIASFIFFAYIFIFVGVSFLQGLKKPIYAVLIGIYRQIVGPLIIYTILSHYFGLKGVWWGVFTVTWSAAIITIFYLRNYLFNSKD